MYLARYSKVGMFDDDNIQKRKQFHPLDRPYSLMTKGVLHRDAVKGGFSDLMTGLRASFGSASRCGELQSNYPLNAT
jgi:hypothetical protein